MANGESVGVVAAIFSEDELSEVSGVKRVGDYVEVTCGCTSHRYGDAVGRLRVFVNGYLEITCECTPGCQEVKGEKVPLFKTVLLKYYNQVSKAAALKSQSGRSHRDEFVRCTICNKERRFRLRSKEECRIHHDALADANWKCSDLKYDKYVFLLLHCNSACF
ncbi:ultrapetala [Stylosanthes scabra]|uniref:Ultrapetala n=1 Tax=Stylosanthes scabra TaxID=79078 RepID=A0ABU6WBD5_9FABA|nr:ultrapetala [Stylosanthes scabra]